MLGMKSLRIKFGTMYSCITVLVTLVSLLHSLVPRPSASFPSLAVSVNERWGHVPQRKL